ncbi:MAG: hypothetical protein K6G39_07905 [Bacteroidales bacterium]|nr:hypothetical protein [Bacteroidales bacterium]
MLIIKRLIAEKGTGFLSGKKVRWSAPAYKGSVQYGGECVIKYAFPGDRHPLHTEGISGDELDCAFWDFDTLAYSDADRFVNIEFI